MKPEVQVQLDWPGKAGRPAARVARLEAVEVIDPSRLGQVALAGGPLELSLGGAKATGRKGLLVRSENAAGMRALLAELKGKVALAYIDPPFATGGSFRFQGGTPDRHAYSDRMALPEWLTMMRERLELLRELLAEHGTLYVHVDWNAGHHLRVLLGEVFGEDCSLGEVIWSYGSPSGGRTTGRKLVKAHETLFVFAKSRGEHRFQPLRLPYSESYLADWFRYSDEDGRRYRKRWRRDKAGKSVVLKQYLDESKGVPASTVWADIQQVYADPRAYKRGMTSEITGYPTQKPLKLLERVVQLSSAEGELVLDAFCGSGTTLLAAERLGRRWVGIDAGTAAIAVARSRLLALPAVPGFEVHEDADDPAAASKATPLTLRPEPGKVVVELDGAGLASWSVDWDFQHGPMSPGFVALADRRGAGLAVRAASRQPGEKIAIRTVDLEGRCCTQVKAAPRDPVAVTPAGNPAGRRRTRSSTPESRG